MTQRLEVKDLEKTIDNIQKAKYFVGCDSESALFVTTSIERIGLFNYSYIALFGEDGKKLDELKSIYEGDGVFILTDDF